ncbi:hypothetical protein Tco_1294108 [Tanacetum coccineum]
MDANKRLILEHPLCRMKANSRKNPLQSSSLILIAASSSVPWIYLGQFWHTLKEDGSKYRLKLIMLDRKELTLTLDDFRTIFHLPQATNNNDDHFVPAPKFSEMVPFYINDLGFTLELRSPSNFKTTGLVQQCCNALSTTSNVDYADLLWEGFYYSLEHPTTLIPYPRFTKHIVSHYMTAFLKILRRDRDKYHNLDDDEMRFTVYVPISEVDIHMTQSQPIGSTQGTHRATSAPRTPNPDITKGESSALRKATVIRLRIPPRRSTRLTPPTLIPTTDEANDIILQDTIQLKEIEKLVEGTKNVEENVKVDSSTLRKNDNQNDPGTRLEPWNNKESPKLEITVAVQPVNVNEEKEESVEDDYKLKRREKEKHKIQELTVNDPPPSSSTLSSSSPKSKLSATNRLLSLFKPKTGCFKRYKSFFDELQGRYGLIMERQHSEVDVVKMIADAILQEHGNLHVEISSQINNDITNHIPSQVDSSSQSLLQHDDLPIWLALKYKFEKLHVSDTSCRRSAIRPRDQDDPHDDAHPEGKNDAKGTKTSEHGTYMFGESSSG